MNLDPLASVVTALYINILGHQTHSYCFFGYSYSVLGGKVLLPVVCIEDILHIYWSSLFFERLFST